MALDRAKIKDDISLTSSLYYLVVVDFFDSADPGTILWTEAFQLPRPATVQQLSDRVVTRGQELRAAFADRTAARNAVPVGTTVTIP